MWAVMVKLHVCIFLSNEFFLEFSIAFSKMFFQIIFSKHVIEHHQKKGKQQFNNNFILIRFISLILFFHLFLN